MPVGYIYVLNDNSSCIRRLQKRDVEDAPGELFIVGNEPPLRAEVHSLAYLRHEPHERHGCEDNPSRCGHLD